MTDFQRCAISIVTHAWCKELTDPKQTLRGQFVRVSLDQYTPLFAFNVRDLSLNSIKMDEDRLGKHFFNRNQNPNDMRIVTEDVPGREMIISERQEKFIRGEDGYGNRFMAEVEGWWKIKITDDEDKKSSPFIFWIHK